MRSLHPGGLMLCLFLCAVGGWPRACWAQVADYTFSQQTGAAWTPLLNSNSTLVATVLNPPPAGLEGVGNYGGDGPGRYHLPDGTIPFPFVFNGHTYTGLWIAQWGYLTFGRIPLANTNRVIQPGGRIYDVVHPISQPVGTGYDGAVAAAGGLLGPRNQGALGAVATIRFQTRGTAPNRVFVVEWARMLLATDGWPAELNFQIQLHETTNVVDIVYGPNTPVVNGRVEVGLRGFTTTDFNNRSSGSFTNGSWVNSTAGTTATASMPLSTVVRPPTGLVYTYTPPVVACARAYSLVADSVTATTAQLRWRVNGATSGSTYTLRYGVRGFNPNTGGTVVANLTDTTYRVAGLQPYAQYQFYVTRACSPTGTSARSVVGEFRTTVINDDPRGAIALPVTATCQPTAGDNTNASTTVPNGYRNYPDSTGSASNNNCVNGNFAPRDVWYTFTTAATGPASRAVTITAVDTTSALGWAAGGIRVFSSANGWHGPFTQVDCARGLSYPQPAVGPLVVANLTPNTTYYVAILEAYNRAGGPFTICVTDPPLCSDPLHLDLPYDEIGATTVKLTFVPGAGNTSYVVKVTPRAGGTTRVVTPAPTASPVIVTGLQPSTDYTVTIQASCQSGGPATIFSEDFTTRPVNDEATTATPLPLNATCQPVTANTHGAHSTDGTFGCGYDYNVWFTVRTAVSGPGSTALRLRTSDYYGRRVALFSAPNSSPAGPFTRLGCASAPLYPGPQGPGVPPLDVMGLTPNTIYYVGVDVADFRYTVGHDGPFTICATPLPTCPEPATVTLGAITTTTVAVSFTPATGNQSFTVTAAPAVGFTGATVTQTVTGSPVTLSGLTPGKPYVLTVQTSCGGTAGQSDVVRRYFDTPVSNNEPAGAIGLPVTATCQPTAATTISATHTPASGYQPGGCSNYGTYHPDVWFTFQTPASGPASHDARITVAGLGANMVRAFSRAAGPPVTFTEVGCSAASGAPGVPPAAAAPLDLSGLTPNTTYYVLVSGYGDAFGSGDFDLGPFTICVTEPLNPCGAPSNLAATNITSTAATLTFNGGTNATGYTVTYAPLSGGAAQTRTGAGSPLPLTGLTPATTYRALLVSNCPVTAISTADTVVFTTPPACVRVDSLTVTGLTPTTATLHFPSSGPATTFTLGYGPVGGPWTMVSPATSPLPLSGLTVGTAYAAFVLGQCPSGEVSDTVWVQFSTPLPPCPQVTGVSARVTGPTSAEISFTPLASATSYVVTVFAAGGGAPLTQTGTASPVVLTGLAPATAYAATVAAECPGNQLSPSSMPVAFLTTPLGLAAGAGVVGWQLWPNPASGRAHVTGAGAHEALQLFDGRGRLVRTVAADAGGEATLPLRGLAPGLYLLRTATAARRLVVAAE